jgi:hypothetical protein
VNGAYPLNTKVTLTAVPNDKWYFAGWRDGASGAANPYTLLIGGDAVVTAIFERVCTEITSVDVTARQTSFVNEVMVHFAVKMGGGTGPFTYAWDFGRAGAMTTHEPEVKRIFPRQATRQIYPVSLVVANECSVFPVSAGKVVVDLPTVIVPLLTR